jgi:hypothetical protein
MGMFAFKRLREQEAASKEVASFSMEQRSPQEEPAERPKRRGRQPKATMDQD